MKKVFFAGACCMVLISTSVTGFAKEKTTTTTTQSPGSFSAGPFGCWGSGFCTTTTTTTTSSAITNNDNGTITFDFDYNTFNEDNKQYYSGKDFFENDADHLLDDELCNDLGLRPGTVVLPGKYRIQWNNNRMIFIANIR